MSGEQFLDRLEDASGRMQLLIAQLAFECWLLQLGSHGR